MGKGINGEDLGKGYYQKANGLYYAKKGVAGEEIYDSDMNLEQLKRRVNKRIKIIKEGPGVIFKNATLNEWFMWWYEKYKAPRLAEQSAVGVLSKYKNIMAEHFGDSRLKLITELDVIDFLEAWTKNPTHAVNSMNTCLGYMNDCFEKAIDYNLIKFNPFKDKKINEKRCIQEVKDKEISYQYFSKSDQEILLQYFYENNHWYYAMLYVALYTGMRVGEVGGLQWKDIDFEKKIIYIRRALVNFYADGKKRLFLSSTKTENSVRIIPFVKDVGVILEKWYEISKDFLKRQKINGYWKGNEEEFGDLVFTTKLGTPVTRYQFEKILNNFEKSYNKEEKLLSTVEQRIPVYFPHSYPHMLRHTFCTYLIKAGIDVKIVQRLMGHKHLSTTLEVYYHVQESDMFDEIEVFNKREVDTLKTSYINMLYTKTS